VKHYCYKVAAVALTEMRKEANAGMAPCTVGFYPSQQFKASGQLLWYKYIIFIPKQLFPNFVLKNSLAVLSTQQVIKSWEGT